MTHGVKGGKYVHGAKEHGQLVRHIENVAEKRAAFDKAKKDHSEFVNELYKRHGGSSSDAMEAVARPF